MKYSSIMPKLDCEFPSLCGQRLCARKFRFLFIVMTATTLALMCGSLYFDVSGFALSTAKFFGVDFTRIHEHVMNSLRKAILPTSPEPPPVILLWTPYFDEKGKWLLSPPSLECPVSDCLITNDRKLLNTSAAVIFHWRNVNISDLPSRPNSDQRWILFNKEAPPHTSSHILEALSDKINWTATYRKDSDLYAPYGWIARRNASVHVPSPPVRRRLVCWLVSNCNSPSGREMYVEVLKTLIPVDVYGKCGDLKCPTDDRLDCYRALSKRCKFYLSFENSICKDYVTEKLFNALRTDMVPIVMGGEDYRKVLPPNSYIDALSFDGPQQLAQYLRVLDKDHDKYLSYLAWKKDYEAIDGSWYWTCELCRKLHFKDNKVHNDLQYWWYDRAACSAWYELANSNLFNEWSTVT